MNMRRVDVYLAKQALQAHGDDSHEPSARSNMRICWILSPFLTRKFPTRLPAQLRGFSSFL